MATIWWTIRTLLIAPVVWLFRLVGLMATTFSAPLARMLSGVALVAAAVALAHDLGPVTLGIPSDITATTVLAHWQALAPISHKTAKAVVTATLGGWGWGLLTMPLTLPAVLVFAGLSLLLGFLGRRRRQVEIFAN
jgi:hypothetical protein